MCFFFSSRRRHTRYWRDWSSDVCSSDLGMSTVLVPRAGGVLSALGLAISDLRRDYVRPYLADLTDVKAAELKETFKDMENAAARDLQGPQYTRRADLRYRGQSFELTVEAEKPLEVEKLEECFHAAHERRYGYRMEDEPVELVDRKSTRLNSSHANISYAVFCLQKKHTARERA